MESEILKILGNRYDGRAIDPEPLTEAITEGLIEAIRLTPSCFNKQPWRFLWIESAARREKAAECLSKANQVWASRAPLIVFGYTRREDDCTMKDGRGYHQFDLGLSVMNLILAATEFGLAARPMAGFNPEKVSETFGLDAEEEVLIALAIGKISSDESHLTQDYQKSGRIRERISPDIFIRRL